MTSQVIQQAHKCVHNLGGSEVNKARPLVKAIPNIFENHKRKSFSEGGLILRYPNAPFSLKASWWWQSFILNNFSILRYIWIVFCTAGQVSPSGPE